MKQVPTFVVSSGRTGSTILARLMNNHPDILVISDLLEPLGPNPYLDSKMKLSGAAFWKMLTAPSSEARIRYWEKKSTHERLFFPKDRNLASLFLCYSLPLLTDNPMDLFREMQKEVCHWPEGTGCQHLARSFSWLAEKFHKKLWVERTGGSLGYVKEIRTCWPEAKIIHNFRDPRETTVSMSKHPFFRLYSQILSHPRRNPLEINPDEGVPLGDVAHMLNNWLTEAYEQLRQHPQHLLHNVKFENLLNSPLQTLCDLIKFVLGVSQLSEKDVMWAKNAAAEIRSPREKFKSLSYVEQNAIRSVCQKNIGNFGYGDPK